MIRSRIDVSAWPDRELLITSVDTDSGEFVTFDKNSDVDLVDAVAASCAVPAGLARGDDPRSALHGRRHAVDGQRRRGPRRRRRRGAGAAAAGVQPATSIAAQLRRIGPVRSVVVKPDKQAALDIGRNVLDPEKRADAARTGLRQSREVAAQVRAVWPH